MEEEKQGFLVKLSKVLNQGRGIEGKLKQLDMEADELLRTSLTNELTDFQEALTELESDALKIGSEEMFSSLKSLREMNAQIIDTYSKMDQYTIIMIKRMRLEVRWSRVFERFEVQADRFYRFAKEIHKHRMLTPAIEDRVHLATKKIAVGIGLLHKVHSTIDKKFIRIDAYIPKDPETQKKYHQEFLERRRKITERLSKGDTNNSENSSGST